MITKEIQDKISKVIDQYTSNSKVYSTSESGIKVEVCEHADFNEGYVFYFTKAGKFISGEYLYTNLHEVQKTEKLLYINKTDKSSENLLEESALINMFMDYYSISPQHISFIDCKVVVFGKPYEWDYIEKLVENFNHTDNS